MDGSAAVDSASSSAPPRLAPSADSHPPALGPHDAAAADDDDRELPVVLQDLVPLSYLIDRVVSSAYSDLATLIETLPGTHDDHQTKKRRVVDHVLNTRRQLVKLLVLTRWSAEAHRVHKAINIVAFLAIQNLAVDHAVDRLNETHQMLARARVRNYDLDSAIATLSLSSSSSSSSAQPTSFPSLPASLTDPFQLEAAAPLSDAEALETLSELNRVLLARLVLRLEPLPPRLADPSTWSIHDGRVTFTQPGLWEADMTYGGGNTEEEQGEEGREWYLLAVRFLFKVKDARGGQACSLPSLRHSSTKNHTPLLVLMRSTLFRVQPGPPSRSARLKITSSTCATANSSGVLTSRLPSLLGPSPILRVPMAVPPPIPSPTEKAATRPRNWPCCPIRRRRHLRRERFRSCTRTETLLRERP